MSNNPLVRLEAATTALAQSTDLSEVRQIRDISLAAIHYARAARLGIEAQNHAAEIKIRAERKAGELLAELERGEAGRPQKIADSLSAISEYQAAIEAADIHVRQARRYQEVARIPEPVFEQTIAEIKSVGHELTSAGLHRAASNHAVSNDPDYDGDEWYTPREYIEMARQVMGRIDLDPASCDEAQEVVKSDAYYTKEDDSLSLEWFGNVWLNPPYSMPLIERFVGKMIHEYDAGRVGQAIILVNNCTETQWFQSLLWRFPVCFPGRRLQFWRSGSEIQGARQGQTLFYLGSKGARFTEVFSAVGPAGSLGR